MADDGRADKLAQHDIVLRMSPRASGFDHLLETYRTAISVPHACLHYRQYRSKSHYSILVIRDSQNELAECFRPPARAHESLLKSPPACLHSTFRNPLGGLRYEYQYDPATVRRYVFDIWSPAPARRPSCLMAPRRHHGLAARTGCRASANHHNIHTVRDSWPR